MAAKDFASQALWEPLTEAQRRNVYTWLDQINHHEVSPNNWCFFRILTNMTFARLGLPVNRERLAQDRAVIEHCYIGNGWYFDGHDGQLDYYIPCGGAWHVRVHKITTAQAVDIADGGFSLPVDAYIAGGAELPDKRHPTAERLEAENGICTIQPWGAAGIYSTVPCSAGMIRPFPNTNLMANLVEIPTITSQLDPGVHLLVHSVFGDVSHDPLARLAAAPRIETTGSTITVYTVDGRSITIYTEGNTK